MPTLFAVYNIKEKQMAEEFDNISLTRKFQGSEEHLGVQRLILGG